MKQHVHSIAMLVFASLIALPCLAAGPSLRPGLWEYTSHRSGAGVVLPPELSRLSPEQQARFRKAMTGIETGQHTMTTHSCLTADQIRHMSFNPEKGRDEKECKSTVKQLSSDRWSMTTHCSRKEGSEQDISGTMHVIDSGHVEQDVTISMREGAQQNHQQMHMVGHWISADCGKAD
ncbi:MAG TPA: DUF3617 domain-containing protein [Rhodanobacter sp.]|nr:DUF3617 domain-containing protein [Rhodanobacter sp.]